MKKLLVTGGTVFVSRYIAEFFSSKGCEVYVLKAGQCIRALISFQTHWAFRPIPFPLILRRLPARS